MKHSVDLNADLGEGEPSEGELLKLVSSANIACGFHAGDPSSMTASILAARDAGVAVGAHPSLSDRENFGRKELPVSTNEVFALVAYQVGAFLGIATSLGVRPNHVKPHGALYNMAARDPALADAVAHGVLAVDRSLFLFAPGGSALARAGEAVGLRIAREAFADRNYQPDGSLVPRTQPNALLHDAGEAESASSACCAKRWCAQSTAAISQSRPTRFACMATRRTRSHLRKICAPGWLQPALRSRRPHSR